MSSEIGRAVGGFWAERSERSVAGLALRSRVGALRDRVADSGSSGSDRWPRSIGRDREAARDASACRPNLRRSCVSGNRRGVSVSRKVRRSVGGLWAERRESGVQSLTLRSRVSALRDRGADSSSSRANDWRRRIDHNRRASGYTASASRSASDGRVGAVVSSGTSDRRRVRVRCQVSRAVRSLRAERRKCGIESLALRSRVRRGADSGADRAYSRGCGIDTDRETARYAAGTRRANI